MQNKILAVSKRTRVTPFARRVEAAGAKAYMVYNHMLLPMLFDTVENDYWHLCEHVQVWDVSCQRQVEIIGPDADRLVQLMTPRDLSGIALLQGKYAPMCDAAGHILNDPIVIKRDENRWWISLADSDIKLWAKGLAQGYGIEVEVFEPDVFPLGVQGPKADDLMARVFGEQVHSIEYFWGKLLSFKGVELYVARSGWSKQGGFEIYLHDATLAEPLWDELFAKGHDLNVRPGNPHSVERVEAGLLSYGTDIDETTTPFECGLDRFLNLNADIESLSLPALKAMVDQQTRKLVGIIFDQAVDLSAAANTVGGFEVHDADSSNGRIVGEVTSQVWSYRYKKHMAIAMLETSYLNDHSIVSIAGQQGKIHDLPFSQAAFAG